MTITLSCVSKKVVIKNAHPKNGEKIVAFGDSLTRGLGSPADKNYPAYLSQMLGFPIINKGIDGDTTRSALARLKTDVLENQPAMVIMTLGLNDLAQKISVEESMINLKSILEQIQSTGAMVVYLSMEPEFLRKKRIKEVQNICNELGVLYIENAFDFKNPKMLFDPFHPNEFGYKQIADKSLPLIKKYFP